MRCKRRRRGLNCRWSERCVPLSTRRALAFMPPRSSVVLLTRIFAKGSMREHPPALSFALKPRVACHGLQPSWRVTVHQGSHPCCPADQPRQAARWGDWYSSHVSVVLKCQFAVGPSCWPGTTLIDMMLQEGLDACSSVDCHMGNWV